MLQPSLKRENMASSATQQKSHQAALEKRLQGSQVLSEITH